jgi:hypothetical protein
MRSRLLKPGFFMSDELYALGAETMLLLAGFCRRQNQSNSCKVVNPLCGGSGIPNPGTGSSNLPGGTRSQEPNFAAQSECNRRVFHSGCSFPRTPSHYYHTNFAAFFPNLDRSKIRHWLIWAADQSPKKQIARSDPLVGSSSPATKKIISHPERLSATGDGTRANNCPPSIAIFGEP